MVIFPLKFLDNSKTSNGMVLILYSKAPVYWRLSFNGDAFYDPTEEQESSYSRNVVVSNGSKVKNYQGLPITVHDGNDLDPIFEEEHQFQSKQHIFDQLAIKKIRNTWGALTTFSRISGANRISISLPQGILFIYTHLYFFYLEYYKYYHLQKRN